MRLLRVLVAGVLAASALLTPVVAVADTYTHNDGRNDLQSMDEDTEVWTPHPERVEGDITWTRVSHLEKAVRVRVKYAELAKVDGGGETGLFLRNGRKTFVFVVNASYGNWKGESDFWLYEAGCDCRVAAARVPAKYTCKNRSYTIDYANNYMLFVIPRSCIDNPKFVRVSIESSRGWEASSEGFDDDAQRSSLNPQGFPPRVYGPKVYR